MNDSRSILIVGATGIVGQQLCKLIRLRHPDLPLLLGCRNKADAELLASELGNAEAMQLDVLKPQPLAGRQPKAVLALVNDPHNYLLLDALQSGCAYLDITRWTARLQEARKLAASIDLKGPVLFASGWMAGLASILATSASRSLATVERIDLQVLYALKDRSGPNSVEYMTRISTPFDALEEGRLLRFRPYSDPRPARFPGGLRKRCYRFDSPDLVTLTETTGARSVSTRIAFDDHLSMPLLIGLGRSGIWELLSDGWRKSLLHNPGPGAAHEFVLLIEGLDSQGDHQSLRVEVQDPLGQTHLTAVGTLLQMEHLLAEPSAVEYLNPQYSGAMEQLAERLGEHDVRVNY